MTSWRVLPGASITQRARSLDRARAISQSIALWLPWSSSESPLGGLVKPRAIHALRNGCHASSLHVDHISVSIIEISGSRFFLRLMGTTCSCAALFRPLHLVR